MITQTHRLDVVPGGVTTVVHVKQYQTDESLVFELFSRFGELEIAAAFTECTVRGTKSDGNGYSANATCDTSNNTVTVQLTEQMTAVAGIQPYEITATDSTGQMITTTFFLNVHRAALDADTVVSESVIKEVQTIVEDYIEDHPGLFVIDDTLTQSGEAADAKVTGDEIADLKNTLDGAAYSRIEEIAIKSGFYLTGTTTIGETYSPTFHASASYKFVEVGVKKGDEVIISGNGGNGSRLWTLVDSDMKVVDVATVNVTANNQVVTAPVDGYLYISFSPGGSPSVVKRYGAGDQLKRLSDTYYDYSEEKNLTKGKYYAFSNLTIGGIPTVTLSTNSVLNCIVYDCVPGDKFKISGTGGSNGRLWIVTDHEGRVLDAAAASQVSTDKIINIYISGKLYINVDNRQSYSINKTSGLNVNYRNYVDSTFVPVTDYYDEYTAEINKTGYYSGTNTVGSLYNPSFTWSRAWYNVYQKVYSNDILKISGTGGNGARLYIVTDNDGYVKKIAAANAALNNFELTIEEDGYIIINLNAQMTYSVTYKRRLQNNIPKLESNVNKIFDGAKIVKSSLLYDKNIPSSDIVISTVDYNPTNYPSLSEIYAGYDALVTNYPEYVTKTNLGKDQSNTYDIFRYEFKPSVPTIQGELQVGTNYTSNSYPVVILDACIHGSERPCGLALLNVMTKICDATDEDGLLGWLRSNIHFVVTPIVNPYGYVNYTRQNSRGVDLNRNFTPFWLLGDADSSSQWYRGSSALSEAETQYVYNTLNTFKDNAIFYYSFHTFGESAQGWEHCSCFFIGPLEEQKLQSIGISLIDEITKSGWKNHNVPTNSGYIGLIQDASVIWLGNSNQQGCALGIPSVNPEVLHRNYDGESGSVYNTDLNTINVEWMLRAIALAINTFL